MDLDAAGWMGGLRAADDPFPGQCLYTYRACFVAACSAWIYFSEFRCCASPSPAMSILCSAFDVRRRTSCHQIVPTMYREQLLKRMRDTGVAWRRIFASKEALLSSNKHQVSAPACNRSDQRHLHSNGILGVASIVQVLR